MPCFPLFYSSFRFILMLGLCAHMLDIISMVILCLDLCVRVLFAMFYAQIRIHTCLPAWIHVPLCLCGSYTLPYLYVQIYVFTRLRAWIYALCHLPCACALHVMLVCLGLELFVMPCAIATLLFLLSHFLVFWPFGSDSIQALWSFSLSIHLGPYQRVWITRFSCLCLLASMFYACVSLSCSRLCHVWHPQRVCGCVVTFDAHEALFGCSHMGCIAMMSVASCTPIPFSTLFDDCLP